jgi:hypothetical protein
MARMRFAPTRTCTRCFVTDTALTTPRAFAPSPAMASTTAANLASLRKLDPSIVDIVGSASHVVLYSLPRVEGSTWEKRGIEGPFFLVSR